MPTMTIGGTTARSKFTPKAVEVDFDKMAEASRDFLLRYGWKQYVSDGVAGAKSQAEFDEGVAERLEKIATSNFSRAKGERDGLVDDVETLASQKARAIIKTALKAKGVTKPDKETMDRLLGQVRAGTKWQSLLDEATADIKARKAAAADFDLDI